MLEAVVMSSTKMHFRCHLLPPIGPASRGSILNDERSRAPNFRHQTSCTTHQTTANQFVFTTYKKTSKYYAYTQRASQ